MTVAVLLKEGKSSIFNRDVIILRCFTGRLIFFFKDFCFCHLGIYLIFDLTVQGGVRKVGSKSVEMRHRKLPGADCNPSPLQHLQLMGHLLNQVSYSVTKGNQLNQLRWFCIGKLRFFRTLHEQKRIEKHKPMTQP